MVDIHTIKHDDKPIPFIDVRHSLIINGSRHLHNACNYVINDKVEYAVGSLRKALRNFEAAQALSDFRDAGLEDYLNRLAQMIANQLMTGEG